MDHRSPPRRASDLARDERAAALLEFCVVIAPLMAFFLLALELARLFMAQTMLQRSAGAAARAAAVLLEQPAHCDGDRPRAARGDSAVERQAVFRAAQSALLPWKADFFAIDTAQGASGIDLADRRSLKVDLIGRLRCVMPVARELLCRSSGSPFGPGERFFSIRSDTTFAPQTARFDCWYGERRPSWDPALGFVADVAPL